MSVQKSTASVASFWSAFVGVVMSIMAAMIAFYSLITIDENSLRFEDINPPISSTASFIELQTKIESINSRLEAISSIPEDVVISAKLAEIEVQLKDLSKQVTVINKAILQSPEKALEIPILKKDIESLQRQYIGTTQALEREMVRAYDTIKWVIGTIILSILGVAASVFLKAKGDG